MKKDFLFKEIINLKGVGPQLSKYFKKKRIEKIKDIILNLPYSETDRSQIIKLNELEIGKIQSVKVKVNKLSFPRIRNLPNKIICEDETGKIDVIYFNSREGYLRKLFPVNEWVIISGKVNYFNKKYQITNPDYVTSLDKQEYVIKSIPKYNLTKGINEKKYRSISETVINNLPEIDDWLDESFIKKNKLVGWNEGIKKLHASGDSKNNKSNSYRRLVFDELCANFLTLSQNRQRIRKKKYPKKFDKNHSDLIIKKLPFKLTNSQKNVFDEKTFTWDRTGGEPIKQGNRNPLLYKNVGVDGVKTGYLAVEKYSLASTMKKRDRRIIAVASGFNTKNLRSSESLKLLNWGFRNTNTFEISKKNETIFELDTWLGTSKKIKASTKEDYYLTINKKEINHLTVSLEYDGPILAPVIKGTQIATMNIMKKDKKIKSLPLYAIEDLKKVNFFKSLLTSLNYLIWGDV